MNLQNQGQPTPQNITARNAAAANANYQQESASELANSPGEISQLLLARSKAGFEFGTMGRNQAANNTNLTNANLNQNSELNQSNGQISRILAQQSQ